MASGLLFGQGFRMSKDKDQFIYDLEAVLKKQNRTTLQELGAEVGGIYASLNEAQRDTLYAICWGMYDRKFKISAQFADFFSGLNGALGVKAATPEQLDQYLNLTSRAVRELKLGELNNYLRLTRDFFSKLCIYYADFNRIFAYTSDFRLEWAEAPSTPVVPEETTPAPEDDVFRQFDRTNADDNWSGNFDDPIQKEEEQSSTDQIISSAPEKLAIPAIQGPVIVFTAPFDLELKTTFDNATLKQTTGTLMLTNFIFVGKGGRMDWSTVELPEDEVYAEFSEYSFNTMNPRIEADGVKLTYDKYLYEPIEGAFSFFSMKKSNPVDKPYPRFISLESNIPLKDLGEGITYKGGFTLVGRRIFSNSLKEELAYLSVSYGGEEKFRANSPRFELQDTAILAEQASVVLYLNKDSIYNPVVRLQYGKEIPDLRLYAPEGTYHYHPYHDTYHKTYITAEKCYFDFTQDSLEFATIHARDVLPVILESEDYFRQAEYDKFKRNTTYNILHVSVLYATKNQNQFYLDELAQQYKLKSAMVEAAIEYLAGRGYVRYNPRTRTVRVLPRAYHFFKSGVGRDDFDNLQIASYATEDANVRIHIRDMGMVVRGIKDFTVSDSLNVRIEPYEGVVEIVNKRDMQFNGKLSAGNYEFSGEKFRFSYDSFLVDMVQIDSIDFIIRTFDTTENRQIAKKLLNNLQRTSGVLFINEPGNKSGRKKRPQYPTFDLNAPAYVYFNQPNVLNGAYDERIYFEVPPFGLDSLSSDDPSTISFQGTMFSSGLFPDFEYTLKVMPDLRLGFDYALPPEGFDIYQGKAKLHKNLRLDGDGFTSNGDVQYLAATAKSNKFTFYQDSLITKGTEFVTDGIAIDGLTFAKSKVNDYQMSWLVAEDSMIVRNTKSPFQMYDGSSRFRGEMVVSAAQGMVGTGRWEDKNAIVKANAIRFNQDRFLADEGIFQIKSEDPYKPAVFARDVNVDYELTERQATFVPVYEGEATVEFPYMQYRTSIPKGVWDFDDNTVTMSLDEGNDIESSYFYSIRPDQDSLVFNAEKGVYDIKTSQLIVSGIPSIQVADARIIPDKGTVIIRENAEMDQLQNAVVVVDTLNEYHTLAKGTVDIFSRYKFQGRAEYRFTNLQNDTFNIIFNDFESEFRKGIPKNAKFGSTIATGEVPEDEPIVLAPKILYKGFVKMHAYKPQLEFDGFVKLDIKASDADELTTDWFAFKSSGESQEIVLNTEGIKSQNGTPLVSGLHIENGSTILYNTFVAARSTSGDQDVLLAEGDLTFDPETAEFTVGNKAKLEGKSMTGSVMVYEDKTKRIRYEGPMRFLHQSPDLIFNAAGSGEASLDSGVFRFNAFVSLGYNAPGNIFMVMADKVEATVKTLASEEAVEDPYVMLFRLAEIIGEDKAKAWDVLKRNKGYTPLLEASSKISASVTLAEVNMVWHEENRAWYSVGPLGVSNIYRKDINAKVNGYFEIKKLPDGEAVYLYLEPTLDTWYFLAFDRKVLSMASSKRDFNDLVLARTKGSEPVPSTYGMRMADASEKKDWLREFKTTYLKYTEAQIEKEEREQEEAESEADEDSDTKIQEEEDVAPDPFLNQPSRKKQVEIDPFTGEEIQAEPTDAGKKTQILSEKPAVKKRFEIDPFTGEKVEIVEEQPVKEAPAVKDKPTKEKKKRSTKEEVTEAEEDPFAEPAPKPSKKKQAVDPFTGEPIEEEPQPAKTNEKNTSDAIRSKESDKVPVEKKKRDEEEELDPFTGEPLKKPAEKTSKKKSKTVDPNQEVDPFTGEPLESETPKTEPAKEEPKKQPKKEESKPTAKPAVEVDPFTGEPIETAPAKPAAKPESKKEEPKPEPVQEEPKPQPKKEESKPAAKPAVEIDPFTGEPIETAPAKPAAKPEPKKEEPKSEPVKEEPKPAPAKEEPKPQPKKEESKPSAKPAVEIDPFTGEPIETAPAKPAAKPEPKKEEPKLEPVKEEPKPQPKKEESKPSVKPAVEVDPFTGEPIETAPAKPAAKPEPKKDEPKPEPVKEEPKPAPAKEVPKPQPKKEESKPSAKPAVEVDPFTGEPIETAPAKPAAKPESKKEEPRPEPVKDPSKKEEPKNQPKKEEAKPAVEIDPFTGEPIEPGPATPKKEEKKSEPKKEEKKPKKVEIDPFTGEPIEDGR
jgi:hypothetical protein